MNFLIYTVFAFVFPAVFSSATDTERDDPRITSTIRIEKDCSAVFSYLGNSDHASSWSVFVELIEPKNPTEFVDGSVGSKRMCYTNLDKSGFNWEEQIIEVEKDSYRKLSCYNFENLFISSKNLVTEQVYVQVDDFCQLSFTLDYEEEVGLWDRMKFSLAAPRIKSIFRKNLANIREEVLAK